MSENELEQALMEYAEEQAEEIATCLTKFRQKHQSCLDCEDRGFCDKLALQLAVLEEGEDAGG